MDRVTLRPELRRSTPFHEAHSTTVAGLRNIEGGDDRIHNNLFVGSNGLVQYDQVAYPVWMSGNIFLKGTRPSRHEQAPLEQTEFDPAIKLVEKENSLSLDITLDQAWGT